MPQASPAPLRKSQIVPASNYSSPVPPPIDGDAAPEDWRLPYDTWEPLDRYGGVDLARRNLDRVRDRIEDDLREIRQAIALRQRELPGWQLWPDSQVSHLRKAEQALRDAKWEADQADRALRDTRNWSGYSADQAARRLDNVIDLLTRADAFLATARPGGRTWYFEYRDGAPDSRNPLDPGPSAPGQRPVPPEIGNPGRPDGQSPGRPGFPKNGRPDNRLERPVPPEIGNPGKPDYRNPGRPAPRRDPQNPLDPGPAYPWPADPRPDRRRDPQNPLDPGPSYPWRPQPPIWHDDLAMLIDRLRRDVRRSIDESREAREYLRP